LVLEKTVSNLIEYSTETLDNLGNLIKRCIKITIVTKTHRQPAVPSSRDKELYIHYLAIKNKIT
jgi:hypothetical protein